jgi:hypothetical protein
VLIAVMLSACNIAGPHNTVAGPPSAQTVAANDSEWSGLQQCPESGSWDHYLSAESAKGSDQYQTDKTDWEDLKSAGANDSYIAVYASTDGAHCGSFGAGNPVDMGSIAYVYAVRFKDAKSAAASYKSNSNDFHLSESDVSNLKAAGAVVREGAATGLGDNSMQLTIDVFSAKVFVSFWQNKSFEVALVSINEVAESQAAAKTINGRIA